ncbi:MAG: hypothetical protein LAN59_12905 [Acidobacteriia bacterium]|nr:hypothetical protein [Terriglobia bacterium]
MHRTIHLAMLAALLLAAAALPVRAQDDNQGPLAPPPKFEVKRVPAVPHPGPPPVPEQEIIRRFTANEDVMKRVYESYNFAQTIRIEELGESGGGKFTVTGEEYTRPDGARFWRVTQPPQSTLKLVHYSLEDVRTMVSTPVFFLTTSELGNYDLVYAGQQQLDELNTYVFQVKPKLLSRTRLFFQGVVFVDDHDFAIVETYGKFVSDMEGSGTKLPFSLFETFRQNIQEKYWLPAYTSSDDYLDDADGTQIHLRLVIRSSDFKLNAPSLAAPPAGQPHPPN